MLLEARFSIASAGTEARGDGTSHGSGWSDAVWVIACMALVGYASLMPFDARVDRVGQVWPTWAQTSAADIRTNLLVYMPVGGLLAFFMLRRGLHGATAVFLSTLLGAGLSASLEALQILLPSRVSSWWDVVFNSVGSFAGAIGAMIGHKVIRAMLREGWRESATRPFATAASLLTIGLFVYNILPCDFVADTKQMHRSFAAAKFNPFTIPAVPASEALSEFGRELTAASWFLLLGGLWGLAGVEAGRRQIAALASAIKQCAILAVTVELLQLFTQSHTAETNSIVMRIIASSMGAWCGVFLLGETLGDRSGGRLPKAAWMPIVAALVFWQFTLLALPGLNGFLGMSASWSGLHVAGLPFERLWRMPGLAGPMTALGTLVTFWTMAQSVRLLLIRVLPRLAWRFALGATLLAAVVVEMIPALLLSRSVDLTTGILALMAAVLAQNPRSMMATSEAIS